MMQKMKLDTICYLYSGGDAPDDFSVIKTDEYKYPVFGNAIANEGLYGYSKYYKISEPSITIASRGSNCGTIFLREEKYVPIVRLISIIPNNHIVDTKYLYYLLSTYKFNSSGSGQPQITIPQLKETKIIINLDKCFQSKVSEILYKIDCQIKRNNEMVQKLQCFKPALNFSRNGGIQYVC